MKNAIKIVAFILSLMIALFSLSVVCFAEEGNNNTPNSLIIPLIITSVVLVIVIALFVLYKFKPGLFNGSMRLPKEDAVFEFKGDNTQLFWSVSVPAKTSKNAIMIVPPTHYGLMIRDGAMSELLESGRHKVYPDNKIDCVSIRLIYISKTAQFNMNWGTIKDQRITKIDPELGEIDIGCFGQITAKVGNPIQFYLEMVAACGEVFTVSDIEQTVRKDIADKIIENLNVILSRDDIGYLDFLSSKNRVQNEMLTVLTNAFINKYGLKVCDFLIININASDKMGRRVGEEREEERAHNREVDKYRKERAFELEKKSDKNEDYERDLQNKVNHIENENIIYRNEKDREYEEDDRERRNRHEDEDRAWKREDAIRADETKLAEKEMYYSAVKEAGWELTPKDKSEPKKGEKPIAAGRFCRICGSGYESKDQFCPVCGAPTDKNETQKPCPKCGKLNPSQNRFCSYCGKGMEN